jgi:hypothetical protein
MRGSRERYWSTLSVSRMSHDSSMKHTSTWMVTLTWKISDIGPQTIQRELRHGRCYWSSEYSVPCSSMVNSLLMFTSVYWVTHLSSFLVGYGIPMSSACFQQDGAGPHTSNIGIFSLHDVCKDSIQSNRKFLKGLSWPLTSLEFNSYHVVLMGSAFQKSPDTIPELKTSIQSEIETVFTGTLTSVPNSFVLQSYKVRGLWGHYMKFLHV